jgi:hypothetical protein
MLRVTIYARYKEQKALAASRDFPQILSEILSSYNFQAEPGQISIRVIKITARGMLADNEVEIMANYDEHLIQNQESICQQLANLLNEKHGMKDCCVWLFTGHLGYYWNK